MITTTVTWGDLISQHDDELADLRDAYDEIADLAREEYGDDALDRTLPGDADLLDDAERDLYVYQQQAAQYDEAAKTIQNRKHVLETLREEFGDGDFEIKMLTGEETMDIETELRMLAQRKDVSVDTIQIRRNGLTVDAATVDAPEGVPQDGADDPAPSLAPNPLTLALWEQVQRFNNAGATDFRPEGLGDGDVSGPGASASSEVPTTSGDHSEPSASPDE